MAIEQPSTALTRLCSAKTLALAAAASLGVFILLFALQSRTANSASVVVALDDDQVSWPYHDAVRQTASGAISSSPAALTAANAGAAPGEITELTTAMSDGQSYFEVSATGSDANAASAGIDAVVTWAIEQNIAKRIAPFDEETALLTSEIETLGVEYDSLQGSEDPLDSARANETAALIAEFERRLVVIETDRAKLLPQFNQIEPASPDNNPLRPVFSAAGAFLAALAALTLLEPTPAKPTRAE